MADETCKNPNSVTLITSDSEDSEMSDRLKVYRLLKTKREKQRVGTERKYYFLTIIW